MMEPVSFKEVLSTLEERLERGLRKARVFPELLQACQPAARRLNAFKALRKLGAELYLDGSEEPDGRVYWVHPIPRTELFAVCRRLGFVHHFAYDGQLYMDTHVKYAGKTVLVHLGEWRPFVEFSKDPLEMSSKEFLHVCEEIQSYCARMKGLVEGFNAHTDRFADGRPVFLTRGRVPEGCRFVADVSRYTEYSNAYVEQTEEDRVREKERIRAEMAEREEEARRLEGLVARGVLVRESEYYKLYEVIPEDAENALRIPVKSIAEKVFVAKMRFSVYDHADISISTPVNYLHALRLLREAGVEATLVRPRWAGLGLRRAIQVYVFYDSFLHPDYYAVLVVPKRVSRLPPIKLAEIIRSRNRIIVVDRARP